MRAYGALMLFAFTWALFFYAVGLSEFEREGLFDQQRQSSLVDRYRSLRGHLPVRDSSSHTIVNMRP